MTAPMDQASELMFWGDPADFTDDVTPIFATSRRMGETVRPLMEYAFGVDWQIADELRANHDLAGIALKSCPGPDYETYMASEQVREHMIDQAFDAITTYGLVEHERTYSTFCGPMTSRWLAKPEDHRLTPIEARLFLDGGLDTIQPVPETDPDAPRPEPRRMMYPVC